MAKKEDITTAPQATGYVTVFANLPHGFNFKLPNGRSLRINGVPVSRLVDVDGGALPAGQYGQTPGVKAEDWEYIEKSYGEMTMFKGGLVYAEADIEYGVAKAEDQQELRHGMEQADPKSGGTKPLTKSE